MQGEQLKVWYLAQGYFDCSSQVLKPLAFELVDNLLYLLNPSCSDKVIS